jgi:hypothetical protein
MSDHQNTGHVLFVIYLTMLLVTQAKGKRYIINS